MRPPEIKTITKRQGGEMSGTWGEPISWEAVCCRAGGRRRYNAHRQALRRERWNKIAALITPLSPVFPPPFGLMAALARELGVSRATVCRDFKTFRSWYGQRLDPFFSGRRRPT
jgi:hypothetical protein